MVWSDLTDDRCSTLKAKCRTDGLDGYPIPLWHQEHRSRTMLTRASLQSIANCHENHLLHLNQGPGANGDSRRRPRGKRGSPISPGRSSTDNARILWQFHEKITPRSGACRRLRSPIAPGCFRRNHSDSSQRCSQCNFASFYTSHLRTHLETYTGEKESKCNQCDYVSIQEEDLRRHMKTHSGEKSTVWFCILSRAYAGIYPNNFWRGWNLNSPTSNVQQLENSAIHLHRIWIYLMLKN